MRKNIDIPEEIVKDLKKMAIDADKDLKNFIQDHLVLLVRGQKKNKKLPQMSNRSGQVAMGHNGLGLCVGRASRYKSLITFKS